MPPNSKGGKGYKKGKHSSSDDKLPEWDPKDGQMPGRVIKKLGNRRFEVFCNDNKKRKCKLCGSMRKSEWVDEGAVVILAVRELFNAASAGRSSDAEDVGDILMTIDRGLYSKMKKKEGVNPLLFAMVEQQDASELRKKVEAQERGEAIEDDIFDEASDSEEEEEEDSSDSDEGLTGEEKAKKKQMGREAKEKKRAQAIDAARSKKANREADDAPVDDKFIDNI